MPARQGNPPAGQAQLDGLAARYRHPGGLRKAISGEERLTNPAKDRDHQ